MNDEVRAMKEELDAVNEIRREQERQINELQKAVLMREDQVMKAEATINTQNDRIKFLEGQVDAYQYCLNCRR